MRDLIRRWNAHIQYIYDNPMDRQRAQSLSLMGAAFIALNVVTFAVLLLSITQGSGIALEVIHYASGAFVSVLAGVTIYLIYSGMLRVAAWLFVALTIGAVVPFTTLQGIGEPAAMLVLMPLVVAGMLLDRRGIMLVAGLLFIFALFGAINDSARGGVQNVLGLTDDAMFDLTIIGIGLGGTLIFLLIFAGGTSSLAIAVERNRRYLLTLEKFDERQRSAADEAATMLAISSYLTEEMLFSAAHIYLFDRDGQLNRYARTGMGTRHAVNRVDWENERGSALADAIRIGETLSILPTDPAYRRGHMMPSSTFGVLLPLLDGDNRVMGVLDVQTAQPDSPFTDGTIRLLRLLANRLSDALRAQGELEVTERALREREIETLRLQSLVAELRRLGAAGASNAWTEYLQGRGQGFLGFDLRGQQVDLTPVHDLPPEVRAALERGEPVVQMIHNEQVVSVPIQLRDETLGAMAFTMPYGNQVSERQLELARIVALRLATALENARLVEQSQAQATRESKANEVANVLVSQQDVDVVLRMAAQSFNEALGAVYTHIYLEPELFAAQSGSEEAVR